MKLAIALAWLLSGAVLFGGTTAMAKCNSRSGFCSCAERDEWRRQRGITFTEEQGDADSEKAMDHMIAMHNAQCAGLRAPTTSGSDCPSAPPLGTEATDAKNKVCFGHVLVEKEAEAKAAADAREARVGMVKYMLKVAPKVQDRLKQDMDTLRNAMVSEGIVTETKPTDEELNEAKLGGVNYLPTRYSGALSKKDLSAAVATFVEHTKSVAKQLPDGEVKKKLTEFVAPQFARDLEATDGYKKFFSVGTTAGATPEDMFELLHRRAMQSDDGSLPPDGMTPYNARMILQFWFENQVRKKYPPAEATAKLDAVARSMTLKVNANFENQSNGVDPHATWASSEPHNGYVLGATQAQGQALLAKGQPGDQSTGIDCSLLVQYAVESQGYKLPVGKQGRTWTGVLVKDEGKIKLQGLRRTPLKSEKDLALGDIVALKGHTYIFAGYSPYAPYDMQVIEARGDAVRTVRAASLDIYGGAAKTGCTTSEFNNPALPQYHLTPDGVSKGK